MFLRVIFRIAPVRGFVLVEAPCISPKGDFICRTNAYSIVTNECNGYRDVSKALVQWYGILISKETLICEFYVPSYVLCQKRAFYFCVVYHVNISAYLS